MKFVNKTIYNDSDDILHFIHSSGEKEHEVSTIV